MRLTTSSVCTSMKYVFGYMYTHYTIIRPQNKDQWQTPTASPLSCYTSSSSILPHFFKCLAVLFWGMLFILCDNISQKQALQTVHRDKRRKLQTHTHTYKPFIWLPSVAFVLYTGILMWRVSFFLLNYAHHVSESTTILANKGFALWHVQIHNELMEWWIFFRQSAGLFQQSINPLHSFYLFGTVPKH